MERQRREFDREKRQFIKTLLGIEPDMELLQIAGKLDYASEGISQLPGVKRDKAREIIESYSEREMELLRQSRGIITDEDRAEMKRLQRQRREELAQILTPQELEEYELRKSETAGRMRGNLLAFEPTEDEFRQIFRLQRAFEEEFDPSTFLDAGDRAGHERRHKAEEELKTKLRETLGEQRYKDYERSQDSAYRWLVQITQRYDLPKERADEIFMLKEAAHAQARQINSDSTISPEVRASRLQLVQNEARLGVETILGSDGFSFYRKSGGQWMSQFVR